MTPRGNPNVVGPSLIRVGYYRLRVTTSLGVGRLGREHVNELVHHITRMTLDPRKMHIAIRSEDQGKELLPQIAIGDRLALGVLPAPAKPPDVPLVIEALHDVRGVTHNLKRALLVLTQGRNDGHDLHALIRRVRGGAAGVTVASARPRPAPRTGIAAAGAVGMNLLHEFRVTHESDSVVKRVTASGSSPRRTWPSVTCSSTSRSAPRTAIHTSFKCLASPSYSSVSGRIPRTPAIGPLTTRTTSAIDI